MQRNTHLLPSAETKIDPRAQERNSLSRIQSAVSPLLSVWLLLRKKKKIEANLIWTHLRNLTTQLTFRHMQNQEKKKRKKKWLEATAEIGGLDRVCVSGWEKEHVFTRSEKVEFKSALRGLHFCEAIWPLISMFYLFTYSRF